MPHLIKVPNKHIAYIRDRDRGDLISHEIANMVSFPIRRLFFVYLNNRDLIRGNHGHKSCWQALFPLTGKISITWYNSTESCDWILTEPDEILVIPPGNKIRYQTTTGNSILGVYCSDFFDPDDYFF